MASTSPFPDAGPLGAGARAKRRANSLRQGSAKARDARLVNGFPDWKGLWPVVSFMMFPAAMALGVASTSGGWPKEVLYPFAGLLGLYVLFQSFRGVELVLACTLFYLPFSTTYVIPIAPGINGTNMLVLLGLFASVLQAGGRRHSLIVWPKGTFMVFLFGGYTALSAITVTQLPGGYSHLMHGEILSYKGWLDQFIFYFICLSCIRDVQVAKRVFVYLCIGSILLVIYALPEMIDKMGRSTIDKSRIGGPHQQANNFGGFVAYTTLPIVAVFLTYIRDARFWLLTPHFLLAAKVLVTTFSRGAYLAMALGSLMAGYFRGRGFLAFWLSFVLCFFLVVPSAIPEAVVVRLDSITQDQSSRSEPAELDKSSQHRLILWRAAGKMIMEDPFLGKGFKGFMYLKAQYTEQDVHESDPHSMYLYIASQMGLPALALFLLILGWSFQLGRLLSRDPEDRFVRAIGIGGASATACYAAICFFGSRAVNLEFTSYFWALFVIMQVVRADQVKRLGLDGGEGKRRRVTAFAAGNEHDASASAEPGDTDESLSESLTGRRTRRAKPTRGVGAAGKSSPDVDARRAGQTAAPDSAPRKRTFAAAAREQNDDALTPRRARRDATADEQRQGSVHSGDEESARSRLRGRRSRRGALRPRQAD